MTWCDPVGDRKQACHELWPHNQTWEKVVQPNEYTGKNLGSSHGLEKANKGLAKVRIQRDVESEKTLSMENATC